MNSKENEKTNNDEQLIQEAVKFINEKVQSIDFKQNRSHQSPCLPGIRQRYIPLI